MSILQNTGIVFHDTWGGGWFCNDCKRYIHPDMINVHKHTGVTDMVLKAQKPGEGYMEPSKGAPKKGKL